MSDAKANGEKKKFSGYRYRNGEEESKAQDNMDSGNYRGAFYRFQGLSREYETRAENAGNNIVEKLGCLHLLVVAKKNAIKALQYRESQIRGEKPSSLHEQLSDLRSKKNSLAESIIGYENEILDTTRRARALLARRSRYGPGNLGILLVLSIMSFLAAGALIATNPTGAIVGTAPMGDISWIVFPLIAVGVFAAIVYFVKKIYR